MVTTGKAAAMSSKDEHCNGKEIIIFKKEKKHEKNESRTDIYGTGTWKLTL